jgi:Rod binding domain-containing protein
VQIEAAGSPMFPSTPALPPTDAKAPDSYAGIMALATKAGQTREQKARDAAEQFVALTFVQPALKSLRETNQAAPPFAPSEGEKQFRALLDAEFARKIVHKAHFGLVDRLAHDLLNPSPGR